jgi:hypothetical protein
MPDCLAYCLVRTCFDGNLLVPLIALGRLGRFLRELSRRHQRRSRAIPTGNKKGQMS